VELLEDRRHMRAYGDRRDEQPRCNLIRREALLHQLEHFPLTVGELHPAPPDEWYATPPLALAKLLDQQSDQAAGQRSLSLQHASQREREANRIDVLEQVAGGACAECVEEVGVRSRDREHH